MVSCLMSLPELPAIKLIELLVTFIQTIWKRKNTKQQCSCCLLNYACNIALFKKKKSFLFDEQLSVLNSSNKSGHCSEVLSC